eukprot:TRINITY_DN1108_c0_g2_i1.p1 TRINITY_DN1108_c0_g2~~TRINITY_DN1108_c0_g2_i1.p1  ORF type:complete len:564 (+),score=72.49 TRINITY_DN1108_c0_g2_i1:160-1851(+)
MEDADDNWDDCLNAQDLSALEKGFKEWQAYRSAIRTHLRSIREKDAAINALQRDVASLKRRLCGATQEFKARDALLHDILSKGHGNSSREGAQSEAPQVCQQPGDERNWHLPIFSMPETARLLCCEYAQLQDGAWLIHTTICKLWKDQQDRTTAAAGATEKLTWLTRMCSSTSVAAWAEQAGCPPHAITATAAASGQLEVLQWCHDTQGEAAITMPVCWNASLGGHIEVLRWIAVSGTIPTRAGGKRALCPVWPGFSPHQRLRIIVRGDPRPWPGTFPTGHSPFDQSAHASPAAMVAVMHGLRSVDADSLSSWVHCVRSVMNDGGLLEAQTAFRRAGGCEALVNHLQGTVHEFDSPSELGQLIGDVTVACPSNVALLVEAGVAEALTQALQRNVDAAITTTFELATQSPLLCEQLGRASVCKLLAKALGYAGLPKRPIFCLIGVLAATNHRKLVEEGLCNILVKHVGWGENSLSRAASTAIHVLAAASEYAKANLVAAGAVEALVAWLVRHEPHVCEFDGGGVLPALAALADAPDSCVVARALLAICSSDERNLDRLVAALCA